MMKLPATATLSLICLILLWPLAVAAAGQPTDSSISVGKLQQEIKSHEEMIVQSGVQETSLLDELEQLDGKISSQKEKITSLQTRIQEQESAIAAKLAELDEVAQKSVLLRNHLMQRLKAFYLMGKNGFLNITFSSNTLPELLLTNDAFHHLVSYDKSVFEAYRQSVSEIERVKRAHELEKTVLEKFLEDADQENKTLAETAEQKNTLLKRVRAQKGLYAQALKEMKKAEDNLTSTLTSLNKTQEQRVRGFMRNKGKLPAPVRGTLTSRFHEDAEGMDATFANGITINTPEHSEVRAVYGGDVIFAGYMRGYGKMIIVDHDLQYYTVTARLDDLKVREGDMVTQGQVIGTAGEMASLFGKGLYFEIRHGSIAEDPVPWLQPGSIAAR